MPSGTAARHLEISLKLPACRPGCAPSRVEWLQSILDIPEKEPGDTRAPCLKIRLALQSCSQRSCWVAACLIPLLQHPLHGPPLSKLKMGCTAAVDVARHLPSLDPWRTLTFHLRCICFMRQAASSGHTLSYIKYGK